MAKKLMTGIVTSDKMNKTIIVRVDRRKRHPLYSKSYTISKTWAVHDENSQAKVGDMVRITESKPISKTKSWVLDAVLEHNPELSTTATNTTEETEL
jgi:small subunit ribosomal protein S17